MSLAAQLVRAEEQLRARGWTGARAFDELIEALKEQQGLPARPSPEARRVAAQLSPAPGDDLLGLAYERFFADLFKGRRGQFFTPSVVGRMLVARLDVKPGETVLDPTCGSGGLLVHAARAGARVRGLELDPRLVELARVGMSVAGIEADIQAGDVFRTEPAPADVVVANPPFSVPIEDPSLLEELGVPAAGRVLSDVLFLHVLERWVRPGGRAGVVLPWSILVNDRFEGLRDRVRASWRLRAVCELPEGVFRPFGGAAGRAGLVWLDRQESQGALAFQPARFGRVVDPGYDVRSQRFVATDGDDVDRLIAGEGWEPLPSDAWVPVPEVGEGRAVGELAKVAGVRAQLSEGEACWVADLADADRSTGELLPRPATAGEVGGRVAFEPHDVLVARLRPNLGNVARAPEVDGVLVGSPEWVVLRPDAPGGWLLHALRSPTFREALPVTGGQTRPRTHADAIREVRLRWPGDDPAARVDRLSSALFAERAALRARLSELQAAVDRYVAGELDDAALDEALSAIERRYPGAS